MHSKMIALTGTNEYALTFAGRLLLRAAADQGLQLAVLHGVRTAAEAWALRDSAGELWRIGAEAAVPELSAHVDRTVTDASAAGMERELLQALREYAGKRAIGAVAA